MMFGFDETIEFNSSPQVKLKKSLDEMLKLLDKPVKNDQRFFDEFSSLFNNARAIYCTLTPTEQSSISLYWSAIDSTLQQMPIMINAGALMGASMVVNFIPALKNHCLQAIALLS